MRWKSTLSVVDCHAEVPAIRSQTRITGLYQMGLDTTDPYPQGFTLSDTWMDASSSPLRNE